VTSRATKIVATLGPASVSPEILDGLILAGVNVVRLNLSHGTLDEHLTRLQAVRDAATRAGRPVGVLADLPGPKVRAGAFPDGGVRLVEGTRIEVSSGKTASSATRLEVDFPNISSVLDVGDRIVLGDGAISLRVDQINAPVVIATVLTGGTTQGRPGVHIPSERAALDTPTARDLELAVAMATAGVDFLALSFVSKASDIEALRAALPPGFTPRIVAKIETTRAVADLAAIIREADAVMVARGDLGLDCPLAEVPHLQKRIIRACVEGGVPVITATQMLESMITSPSPTRAEVSDVANAVFDGTDAVMLSGETAVGHDPVLVVRTMAEICDRAEAEASYRAWARRLGQADRIGSVERPARITYAVTHAAWQAGEDIGADAIICCTRSGSTARAMARYRPQASLVAVSPDITTVHHLTLSWGVMPLKVDFHAGTDDMVWHAVQAAVTAGYSRTGDTVVVLAGTPDQPHGATDVLRVVEVG
jgi:pyruvate kinase